MTKNIRIRSSFDDFLTEEGIKESTTLIAKKRTIIWQLEQAMDKKNLTKTDLAKLLPSNSTSIEQIFNPDSTAVTLETLEKIATILDQFIAKLSLQ